MGLFGIKTKKEKAAEAEKAKKAAEEEALIADIKYWPREQCKRELKAIEDGKRDYSYSVRSAIKSRHTHLCIEAGEDAKRREYDRKIAAQEKEISTLKGRSPWTVAGGAGGCRPVLHGSSHVNGPYALLCHRHGHDNSGARPFHLRLRKLHDPDRQPHRLKAHKIQKALADPWHKLSFGHHNHGCRARPSGSRQKRPPYRHQRSHNNGFRGRWSVPCGVYAPYSLWHSAQMGASDMLRTGFSAGGFFRPQLPKRCL